MTPGNGGRSTHPKTARRRWRGNALRRTSQSNRDWDRGNPRGGQSTPMPTHKSLRLPIKKHNRLEPDMNIKHTQQEASRVSGALAGGMGAGPHEQPQLFAVPQTSRTSDDYWTPAWVFTAMAIDFDIDVASPPGGSPWVPAKTYYTQETNGLASPWTGRVWMNPPYSNASPWVRKFIQHKNGICLVPFARSRWVNELWETADAIVMNDSTFKFHQGSIFIQTMFAAFGNDCVEAIKRLGHLR